jgi:hypothetical protein
MRFKVGDRVNSLTWFIFKTIVGTVKAVTYDYYWVVFDDFGDQVRGLYCHESELQPMIGRE